MAVAHQRISRTNNPGARKKAFAAEGKVAPHYTTDSLDNINGIFDEMRAGQIDGRIVMTV